jgi:site-specific recombinase XerC
VGNHPAGALARSLRYSENGMSRRDSPAAAALLDDLESWSTSLEREARSAQTIRTYKAGVRQYLSFCLDEGLEPALDRTTAALFTASLVRSEVPSGTVRSRQSALRQFARWRATEHRLRVDPLFGLTTPTGGRQSREAITDAQLRRLLNTCSGSALADVRDRTIILLMVETGLRVGQLIAMTPRDVDVNADVVRIKRTDDENVYLPISAVTSVAITAYLRARESHPLRASQNLWLGASGRGFSYNALFKSLRRRADRAELARFHPLQLARVRQDRMLERAITA